MSNVYALADIILSLAALKFKRDEILVMVQEKELAGASQEEITVFLRELRDKSLDQLKKDLGL